MEKDMRFGSVSSLVGREPNLAMDLAIATLATDLAIISLVVREPSLAADPVITIPVTDPTIASLVVGEPSLVTDPAITILATDPAIANPVIGKPNLVTDLAITNLALDPAITSLVDGESNPVAIILSLWYVLLILDSNNNMVTLLSMNQRLEFGNVARLPNGVAKAIDMDTKSLLGDLLYMGECKIGDREIGNPENRELDSSEDKKAQKED